MNSLRKTILAVCGTISVALAAVGVFLPLLPTTPFLLLAAVCYANSSERFYRGLLANRWCGEYIRNYRDGKGIARRHKFFTLALLWLVIGVSAFVHVRRPEARMLLFGIAIAVTIHVLTIKTYRLGSREDTQ